MIIAIPTAIPTTKPKQHQSVPTWAQAILACPLPDRVIFADACFAMTIKRKGPPNDSISGGDEQGTDTSTGRSSGPGDTTRTSTGTGTTTGMMMDTGNTAESATGSATYTNRNDTGTGNTTGSATWNSAGMNSPRAVDEVPSPNVQEPAADMSTDEEVTLEFMNLELTTSMYRPHTPQWNIQKFINSRGTHVMAKSKSSNVMTQATIAKGKKKAITGVVKK